MVLVATALVVIGSVRGPSTAQGSDERGGDATQKKQRVPFEDAKIPIEHNATDENTGLQVFVHVTPGTQSLTVPPEFLEPDTAYQFEVLALEAGGTQTLSSSTFRTPSASSICLTA
jgi:hypothetical protein